MFPSYKLTTSTQMVTSTTSMTCEILSTGQFIIFFQGKNEYISNELKGKMHGVAYKLIKIKHILNWRS